MQLASHVALHTHFQPAPLTRRSLTARQRHAHEWPGVHTPLPDSGGRALTAGWLMAAVLTTTSTGPSACDAAQVEGWA